MHAINIQHRHGFNYILAARYVAYTTKNVPYFNIGSVDRFKSIINMIYSAAIQEIEASKFAWNGFHPDSNGFVVVKDIIDTFGEIDAKKKKHKKEESKCAASSEHNGKKDIPKQLFHNFQFRWLINLNWKVAHATFSWP